jgi:hypothetical protein
MRQKYYKAAGLTLDGPLRRGMNLYLPGTTHRPDWFDPDAAKSCTHGLYYTAHRRVAARWGPVVMEVKVLGTQLKTDEKVRPTAQPHGIAANKYQKYRTDLMEVVRIVGVTGYSERARSYRNYRDPRLLTDAERSQLDAEANLEALNRTLREYSLPELKLTGESLERLRDDGFQLWEVE